MQPASTGLVSIVIRRQTAGTALLFSVECFTSFFWVSSNRLQFLKHTFIGKYIDYEREKSWAHLNPEMTIAMNKKENYHKKFIIGYIAYFLSCLCEGHYPIK